MKANKPNPYTPLDAKLRELSDLPLRQRIRALRAWRANARKGRQAGEKIDPFFEAAHPADDEKSDS